jgi:transcriptional regulator GlxA family with amidase domain
MDARVKATIRMMHRLASDKLSIDLLSRSVNLSPARLRQLFDKETGRSPIQYLKQLRMKRAAALLRSSFLSVKEVVFASGARDVSNFVRDFKKQYGLTPSKFRAHRSRRTRDGRD